MVWKIILSFYIPHYSYYSNNGCVPVSNWTQAPKTLSCWDILTEVESVIENDFTIILQQILHCVFGANCIRDAPLDFQGGGSRKFELRVNFFPLHSYGGNFFSFNNLGGNFFFFFYYIGLTSIAPFSILMTILQGFCKSLYYIPGLYII